MGVVEGAVEINDRRTQLFSGQRIRPCPLFELISWGQVFGINYTDSWLCGLLPIFCRQSRITVTLAATTFDILTLALLNCQQYTCHDPTDHSKKHTKFAQHKLFPAHNI